MQFSRERQGELIIIFEALLWSLFPIVTISIYRYVSPLFTLAFGSLFSAIFFTLVIVFQRKWREIRHKKAVLDVLFATLILALFWGFVFEGMQFTSPGNASIVLLMEIFFSFLFFGIWQKESYRIYHILGAIIMALGAIVILFPGTFEINKGDLIILIGTIFPPLANHFQQEARKKITSSSMLFLRKIFELPIFFTVAYFSAETFPSILNLKQSFLLFLFSGIVLFGISKIMWIEGIHRISVAKATSLNSLTPAFTLFFAYLFLKEIPTLWQIFGFLPILIGGILITRK